MSDSAHQVLAAACKAVGVPSDAHARGPKPDLHNRAYVALALWIAERAVAAELVKPKDRAEHAALTRWAERVLDRDPITKAEHTSLRQRFPLVRHGRATGREINLASPVVFAEGAALEALVCLDRDVSGRGARPAAAELAKRLGASFLGPLATEIERLEVVALIERHALDTEDAVIAASLWRGTTGAKATHFIARLADGRHALVAKTKGRWTWSAGPRDDILGSVPDALMESAVSAVLGDAPKKRAARPTKDNGEPRAVATTTVGTVVKIDDAARDDVLAGVAIDASATGGHAEPTVHFALASGTVGVWDTRVRLSGRSVGTIRGIVACPDGAVISWGDALTRWRDLAAERVGEAVDGALVTDDESLVTWRAAEGHLTIGKKRVAGLEGQRVLVDSAGARVLSVSAEGVRIFTLKGALAAELPLGGDGHALSPDGTRLARWTRSPRAKAATIHDARSGSELATLAVDKGEIDQVTFVHDARAAVLVRYHGGQRIAAFDREGRPLGQLAARDLGTKGSAVDFLFPLAQADVIAFAPWPRGHVWLVRWDATLVADWKLERFGAGPQARSAVAEAGRRVAFGHSYQGTRLLRFERTSSTG